MTDTKVLLGRRIKSLRRNKDYSQEQLAENAGVSAKYLGEVERGQANISLEILEKLSTSLETKLTDLLDFEHEIGRKQLVANINSMVRSADDNSLQIVLRVIKAILK